MIRVSLIAGLMAAAPLASALPAASHGRALNGWRYYPRPPPPPPSGPTCGDGKTEGSEECDDGNRTDGDGCSKRCKIEHPPPSGPTCGDGTVDGGEECDDGNTESGDGCSSTCKDEPAPTTCGNGVIDPGEDCEPPSTPGCSSTCTIVECPACPVCPVPPSCGDGEVNGDETCDDGNDNDNDGCRNDCTSCGDGIVNGGEECDGGDDCLPNCTIKPTPPSCGDGIVNGNESCDDGNKVNTDDCRNDCTFCGDGKVNGSEACDDGNDVEGDGCEPDCTVTPVETCGDGIVQGDESCDDGNDVETDGCRSDCTFCGDGIVNGGEECDEGPTGNVVSGACRPDCTLPPENCGFCKPKNKDSGLDIGKPESVMLGWSCDGPPPASITDNSGGTYDAATGVYEAGGGDLEKDLEISYGGITETLHLSCSAPLGRGVKLQSEGQSKKCQGGCGDEPECTGCFIILGAISEEGRPYCDLDCSQVKS